MLSQLRCVLVFSIFCSCFSTSFSKDAQIVKFTVQQNGSGKLQCDTVTLNVKVKEEFQILVNHTGYYLDNYVARCETFPGSNYYETSTLWKLKDSNDYLLNWLFTASAQSGIWNLNCIFYATTCESFTGNICNYYHYVNNEARYVILGSEGVKCITTVHVHEPREAGSFNLSANNKYFFPDNKEVYKFYDGESANFICETPTGTVANLTYTTRGRKRLIRSQQTNRARIYMKLRATNDEDILECTMSTLSHVSTITLKLVVDNDRQGILVFAVNSLILPQTDVSQTGDDNFYQYNYFIGETLTVTLIKDNGIYSDESCVVEGENIPETLKYYFRIQPRRLNFVTFTNKMDTEIHLLCTVLRISDSKQFHIKATFSLYKPDYSPYITGLSMSSVLLQYSNDVVNKIVYDIGSQTLLLNCYTLLKNSTYPILWERSDPGVKPDRQVIIGSVQLKPDRNSATIECIQDNYNPITKKITYLKLIRGSNATITTISTTQATIYYISPTPEETNQLSPIPGTTNHASPIPGATNEVPSIPEATNEVSSIPQTVTQATNTDSPTLNTDGYIWAIVPMVVVLLLLMTIGLCKVFNYKKKRGIENNPSEEDSSKHQKPLATSSQWYQTDNVTYAEPVPKNKRIKISPTNELQEPTTSINIQRTNNEPTYASVQSEPTYANQTSTENQNAETLKVGKTTDAETKDNSCGKEKDSHNQNRLKNNSNDIVYAALYHKNDRVSFNVSKMPIYSEIISPKLYENTGIGSKDNNIEYVNGDVSNDVDPAYCEVTRLKE